MFFNGKMDKKGSNLHIYFWAIVPVEEVDLQLNLIILYFIFQRQYYVQKTGLKPFWSKTMKSCVFLNCIENGCFKKEGQSLGTDKKSTTIVVPDLKRQLCAQSTGKLGCIFFFSLFENKKWTSAMGKKSPRWDPKI